MKNVLLSVSTFVMKGDERTLKAKKNIASTVVIKGGSILVNLWLVPIIINYITAGEYGIWITLSSIVSWMTFFDIGLGNGLRNKLALSVALNNYSDAKKYISTTYAALGVVSFILILVFFTVNPFLNWKSILNVKFKINDNLQVIGLVVLCSFCLQFVLQTINTVLIALHSPSKASLISFIGQIFVLVTIVVLKSIVPGSILILVLVLTGIPIITLTISSFYLYKTQLKEFAPSFKSIEFRKIKSILNVGGSFFIIQIGAIFLFQTDNMVITRVIGPEAVTSFNVAYKLFSVITMIFSIIVTPYWSAFTDAYAKADFVWMKRSVLQIRKLWFVTSVIIIPVVFSFSKYVIQLWIGDKVSISPILSLSMCLHVVGYTCLMLNCYFINGVGKIRLQLYLYVVATLINIPLGILLARQFGVVGVTLSNVLIFAVMSVVLWIQTNKILNRKDSGIWSH